MTHVGSSQSKADGGEERAWQRKASVSQQLVRMVIAGASVYGKVRFLMMIREVRRGGSGEVRKCGGGGGKRRERRR